MQKRKTDSRHEALRQRPTIFIEGHEFRSFEELEDSMDDCRAKILRGRRGFNVFDGDVILAYVEKPDFWSTDARNSGLYLCSGGAYRKLLYTPGKGYVRKGRPDVDDELEVQIQKGAFNSHVLTMSQCWKRIGNVHVDIGFLIENPKEGA